MRRAPVSNAVQTSVSYADDHCVLKFADSTLRMDMTVDFRFKVTGMIKGRAANLVLDCSQVKRIDSSFISSIFAVGSECEERGGKLCVVTDNAYIRKLLTVGGTHQPVGIFDTVDDAVASL